MTMSLEDQLAAYGDTIDLAVDRYHSAPEGFEAEPSTGPGGRGSRFGRRGALVAAVTVAAVAGGIIVSSGGSSSPAWADWTPLARPAAAADVDALDSFCRSATSADGLDALIFDIRGTGAVAIYGDDTRWVTCHAERGADGDHRLASTTTGTGADLAAARAAVGVDAPVAVISLGWQGAPPASLIWGVRAGAAERIEIATVDAVVETATSGDVWVGWWPTGDADAARIRGIDTSGSVLVDSIAGELAPALPDPSTIAADVAAGGTALEREILADGTVTWPEFVSALAAWQACVADDGYELTIEIDDATRSHTATSPVVSIDAPAGVPDDAAARQLLEPIDASIDHCRTVHVTRLEQFLIQQ